MVIIDYGCIFMTLSIKMTDNEEGRPLTIEWQVVAPRKCCQNYVLFSTSAVLLHTRSITVASEIKNKTLKSQTAALSLCFQEGPNGQGTNSNSGRGVCDFEPEPCPNAWNITVPPWATKAQTVKDKKHSFSKVGELGSLCNVRGNLSFAQLDEKLK